MFNTSSPAIDRVNRVGSSTSLSASSGIPSLDALIGGPYRCGSVALFESDFHGTGACQIVNHFVADGLASGHHLLYCAVEKLETLLSKLPDAMELSDADSVPSSDLRIAWRYKQMGDFKDNTSVKPSPGHQYDLSKLMDTQCRVNELGIRTSYFAPKPGLPLQDNLSQFLQNLNDICLTTSSRRVQRVVLNSLFSPFWGFCNSALNFERLALRFFTSLRLLVQDTTCVVLIIVPDLQPSLMFRLRHYAHYAFRISGFDGTATRNPSYADFDGIVTAHQLPCFHLHPNRLLSRPLTLEWAFKIKRRHLVFQHLRLPPCVSDSVSRSTASEPILPCGARDSLDKRTIDF